MTFDVLAVRASEDPRGELLYPELADEPGDDIIRLTEFDGDVERFTATAIRVYAVDGQSLTPLATLEDNTVRVCITQTRVTFACSSYDKGAHYVGFGLGGAIAAAASNVISEAVATSRSKGKALVGQVRYPWLSHVGARSTGGWKSREYLRVCLKRVKAEGGQQLVVDLELPKTTDSFAIALSIARRNAAFRMRLDATFAADDWHRLEPEAREQMSRMVHAERLKPNPQGKHFAMYAMPEFFNASHSTAYPSGAAGSS